MAIVSEGAVEQQIDQRRVYRALGKYVEGHPLSGPLRPPVASVGGGRSSGKQRALPRASRADVSFVVAGFPKRASRS
jgi:hypothetical protein